MEAILGDHCMNARQYVNRRRAIQWTIAPIVVITIALGWKYPILGFSVPIVMVMGMIGGLFNGRYVCGNLCPRGAFFDRYWGWTVRKRHIPSWMRSAALRWVVFGALMAFMIFRITRNPGDWRHWGRVFWLMCAVTTGLGLVFVAFIHPRGWCSICPMGTMQNFLGGGRRHIRIDSARCRLCHKCERVCPMDIPITQYKEKGFIADRDCLKCRECVAVCPFGALEDEAQQEKTVS